MHRYLFCIALYEKQCFINCILSAVPKVTTERKTVESQVFSSSNKCIAEALFFWPLHNYLQ